MPAIDKQDRRILYELDRNSRLSFAQIAKKMRTAPETVRYRIGKLVDEGVIKRFFTLIDISRAGFSMYKLMLKLQTLASASIQEILDYLVSHPSVMWVVRFEGTYDIGVVLRVSKVTDMDTFVSELSTKFCRAIAKRSFSVNIRGHYLPRNHLLDKDQREKSSQWYSAANDVYPLDNTSTEILKMLAADSRTSAVAIAKHLETVDFVVPISPEAVLQRIKKLEIEKVITGYSVLIDSAKVNRFYFKVLLFLNELDEKTMSSFIEYCMKKSSIIFLVKALGEWDYELDLEVSEVGQCRETLVDSVHAFPDVIRDHVPLMITNHLKYNYFPNSPIADRPVRRLHLANSGLD